MSTAISSGRMPLASASSMSAPAATQPARGFEPAVARGVEQRRHAALRFGAPAAIRQAAAVDADAFGAAAGALARRHELRRRSLPRLRVDGRAGSSRSDGAG